MSNSTRVLRASEKYREDFNKKLRENPLGHALRVIGFQGRCLASQAQYHRRRWLASHNNVTNILQVPSFLQPPNYQYGGYRGPWIEDFFLDYFLSSKPQTHFTYLPILFDRFFTQSQSGSYPPKTFQSTYQGLTDFLKEIEQQGGAYFTLLGIYDFPIWGWSQFPKNVAVFSANGNGDFAIPLLKGSPQFQMMPKTRRVSFMGKLDGYSNRGNVRKRMYEAMKNHAYFGYGSNWREVMASSVFTLCPRGLGRASFRLYEALGVGSIPIYIWDDIEWLPYKDVLDRSEFSISINIDDIDQLPAIIANYTEADIRRKQAVIRDVYDMYFTFEGVCENIIRILNRMPEQGSLLEITSQRHRLTKPTAVEP